MRMQARRMTTAGRRRWFPHTPRRVFLAASAGMRARQPIRDGDTSEPVFLCYFVEFILY